MEGLLWGAGVIMFLIGGFLSKETSYAKYSGTELVGFEDRPRFKNQTVRTIGGILFTAGIVSCCVASMLGGMFK